MVARGSIYAVALACSLGVVACGGSDDGAGGAPSSDSSSGGAPDKLLEFTFVLHGTGKITTFGSDFGCNEDACTATLKVNPNALPLEVQIVPALPDWVPATTTVDGGPVPPGSAWDTISVSGATDHTIDVAFVELAGCTPTSMFPEPPTLALPKEMCVGRSATIYGTNVAQHLSASPPDIGVCASVRGVPAPATYQPFPADTPSVDAGNTFQDSLVLNLPADFPTGSAWIADRTPQGLFIGQTEVLANLPPPVLTSVSPATAHAGDTITITGSSLDHVDFIRLFCETGCDQPDGILSEIDSYVTPSSPTTIEYKLVAVDPGMTFAIQVSNACADSNQLPIAVQ